MKAPLEQNSFGVGDGGAGASAAAPSPLQASEFRKTKTDHLIAGKHTLRKGEIQVWVRYKNGIEGRAVRFINAETGSFMARFFGTTLIILWVVAAIGCFFIGVGGCAELAFEREAGWGSIISFTPLLILIIIGLVHNFEVFRCSPPFYRTVEIQFWPGDPPGNSYFLTIGGSCDGARCRFQDLVQPLTIPPQPPQDDQMTVDVRGKKKKLVRSDLVGYTGQFAENQVVMVRTLGETYPSEHLAIVKHALEKAMVDWKEKND